MSGSITNCLIAYRDGDRRASQALWNRYFSQLVTIARTQLQSCAGRRMQEEEDVALSALNSLFRGIEGGRYPNLNDRDGLWRLLVNIASKKAISARRRQTCKKRTPANGRSVESLDLDVEVDDVVSSTPSPEFCVMAAESLGALLKRLGEGNLPQIAIYKLEGYTNDEIAVKLGCSLSTIERKLARIRHEWSQHMDD